MSDAQAHSMSYNHMESAAFLADGKMVRDHYVRVGNPNAITAWAERFDRTDVFASFTGLRAQARRPAVGKNFKRGWRMPPCLKAIEAGILPDGVRHRAYFSLGRAFRSIGMHPHEIRERLEALDSRHPIRDPDYIGRAVEWGCAHPRFPGCQDEFAAPVLSPPGLFLRQAQKQHRRRIEIALAAHTWKVD